MRVIGGVLLALYLVLFAIVMSLIILIETFAETKGLRHEATSTLYPLRLRRR